MKGKTLVPVKVSPARSLAYDAFREVRFLGQAPDVYLQQQYQMESRRLKQIDRNFVKELLYGSLRWYSKIHWILQNISKRKLEECSPEVVTALVLGGYQIFYLDRVPDRAAVNESVEYVRERNLSHAVSFVNGVLRTASRRSQYFPKPDKSKAPVEFFALQYAHPEWMVRRWMSQFKPELLKEILVSNNRVPVQFLRLNVLRMQGDEVKEFRSRILRESRVHTERRCLRSCLSVTGNFNPQTEKLFEEGLYSVQGEASQLISVMLAPQAGDNIVDACCGRGGKMAHLFELSGGQAKILGVDPQQAQLERAQESFVRLGFDQDKLSLWHGEFGKLSLERAPDKILLDAPCSGLGVLRRHPEGKWHKPVEIIEKMYKLQRQLIKHALQMLKVGGYLVYSVCSFEPEETSHQLEWIEKEFGDNVEVQRLVGRVPDYYRRYFVQDKLLLIYPSNKDDMDGFGAFMVRKVSE
ncbi:MAG: methyltransferase domain-containing protein [Zetaproteobacteria bacterium]|nr:methyltransferase domain-containing protein [Zetaproteobacteria bacterium]